MKYNRLHRYITPSIEMELIYTEIIAASDMNAGNMEDPVDDSIDDWVM